MSYGYEVVIHKSRLEYDIILDFENWTYAWEVNRTYLGMDNYDEIGYSGRIGIFSKLAVL